MIPNLRHNSHPHLFPSFISTMTLAKKIEALKVDKNRLMSSGDTLNPPVTLIPNFLGHLTYGKHVLSKFYTFLTKRA